MTGITSEEATYILEYSLVHQLICPPRELLGADPELGTAKI